MSVLALVSVFLLVLVLEWPPVFQLGQVLESPPLPHRRG